MHIRKRILFSTFIFLSILFANTARAQTPVTFGIHGGLNVANFNDSGLDTEYRTGYAAGFYATFHLYNSPVQIQSEVLYTRKGATFKDENYRIDYVEVPVLARYNFSSTSNYTPHFYVGPYVGFMVNSELPVRNPDTGPFISPINDGDGNPLDFGLTVGVGIDFSRFEAGLRYNTGFTEVFDDDELHAKNGVFSIIIGTNF